MNDKQAPTGGVGFLSLLLLAFIVLKLCGVIEWSWVWVLSPFWIPLTLAVVILVVLWTLTLVLGAKQ